MDLSIPELCGQLIVGGFDGVVLAPEMKQALADGRRGGIILFKRNLPSVQAAHEITSTAVDAARDELPPFVGVDEEGGRVRRLPAPVMSLPPMRTLGKIGDVELVRRAALLLGRELAAIGFNLDFAPVLDVDSNPKNPIIGDRAFAADPDSVARYGRAFADGLAKGGVLACGKHFPGHGDTDKDSHVALPVLRHDKARLDAVELPPFRAASHAGIPTLMSAHIVLSEIEAGVPATLSHRVCTGLLRNELGFRGVLFSDDLEMRALSDNYEIAESAVGAIAAGCDALLICRDFELQEAALEALVQRAEQDTSFASRCRQALARSLAVRRQTPPRPLPSVADLDTVLGSSDAQDLLAEIKQRSKR